MAKRLLNCGMDEAKSGRAKSAVKWFQRAINLGDVNTPFHLAKLYLGMGCNLQEATALLKMRISAGPQASYTVAPGTEPMLVLEDADFDESQKLLTIVETQLDTLGR